jgi:hypothetical protein
LGELAEIAERQEAVERKQKHLWIRPWIIVRPEVVPLYKEIQENDPEKFYANFRFSPDDFKILLSRYLLTKLIAIKYIFACIV